MTTKCTGLMGRIFGHKFVPVITRSAQPYNMNLKSSSADFLLEAMEKNRKETFNGALCQRCGAVTGEKK